jgi:hypothetical protein
MATIELERLTISVVCVCLINNCSNVIEIKSNKCGKLENFAFVDTHYNGIQTPRRIECTRLNYNNSFI